MIKNIDLPILDIDGKPLAADLPMKSIKSTVVHALLTIPSDDRATTGDEKCHRYALALRINQGGDQEFSHEDLVLIKKLVGEFFLPLWVGQVWKWADE